MDPTPLESWEFDRVRFFPATGQLEYDGSVHQLNGIPRRLLMHLLSIRPKRADYDTLVKEVWRQESKAPTTVRGAVKQVRDALGPHADLIQGDRDGYFFGGEARFLSPEGVELQPFPGAPKIKVRPVTLAISMAIQEMTSKGWGSSAIEWIIRSMEEFGLGMDSKEVLLFFWLFHLTRGDFEKAKFVAERSVEFATTKAADPHQRRAALTGLGVTLTHIGKFDEAAKNLEAVLADLPIDQEIFEVDRYAVEPGTAAFCQDALVSWFRGLANRSLRSLSAGRQRALKFQHPQTYAFALIYSGWIHLLRREPKIALNYGDEVIWVLKSHALRQLEPWSTMINGWATSDRDRELGATLIQESLARQSEIRSQVARTCFLTVLAEISHDDRSAALRIATDALNESTRTGESFFLPEILRVRGEILFDLGSRDEAFKNLEDASRVARCQGSRMLHLRTLCSMLRMYLRVENMSAEAVASSYDDLRRLYEAFTEGHETPDLAQASFLLRSRGRKFGVGA